MSVQKLLEAGWECARVHPRKAAQWIDPRTGEDYSYQDALRILDGKNPVKRIYSGNLKASQTHDYARWTRAGVQCHYTDKDCENCDIWKYYGLKDGKGCYQPEANKILMKKGVNPPRMNPYFVFGGF